MPGNPGHEPSERPSDSPTDRHSRESPAALTVLTSSGQRTRVAIRSTPFSMGRHADNNLVMRDNRASREHARIVWEDGHYVIEDLNSRHGTWVNGEQIARHILRNSDRIEFGVRDSYQLTFTLEQDGLHQILDQFGPAPQAGEPLAGDLSKLRAVVEVARALQSALSTNEVLTAVVDAALSVTGCERGFLLLRKDDDLEVSVARDQMRRRLDASELRVPRSLIRRALASRKDLLSMSFDPYGESGIRPEMTVAQLELRSVICLPLIQIRSGTSEETGIATALENSVGLIYMDSRLAPADLSVGNRELLQTLAIEASTILENARLLEQERVKIRIEDELKIAREIQRGLQPASLPSTGWIRAAGSSVSSTQVGGDYFDVRAVAPDVWTAVVADVSGKGVSSRKLGFAGESAPRYVSDGVGGCVSHGASHGPVERIFAGQNSRRKIRDDLLLHSACGRHSALYQRRALRSVRGEPGWPAADHSNQRAAGGDDGGGDVRRGSA